MPVCLKCSTDKPSGEFRVRADRNNFRVKNCRPCERVVQLENYYDLKQRDRAEWRFRIVRAKFGDAITREWISETLAKQGNCCAISGRPINAVDFEVDHIEPESKGGSGDLSNLRLVCRAANAAKGDLTDAELIQLCHEIIGRAIMRAEGLSA